MEAFGVNHVGEYTGEHAKPTPAPMHTNPAYVHTNPAYVQKWPNHRTNQKNQKNQKKQTFSHTTGEEG